MDSLSPPSKEDPNPTATATFITSNGGAAAARKEHQPAAEAIDQLYRECLRNHASSLGGHALDGCGEFMPSPSSDPAVPTSLRCAACGCHRNFHRRLSLPLPNGRGRQERGAEEEDEDEVHEVHHQHEEDEEEEEDRLRRSSASPQPPPLALYASAPHMLMALSAGLPGGSPVPVSAAAPPQTVMQTAAAPRKRFRSKFSPEQKGRMMELSERLGWRMLKRDEGLVEETCREIGVDRGVFKVWMHNNKHTSWAFSRRANSAAAATGGGSVGAGGSSVGFGNDGNTFHRVGNGNGRSSSGDGHLMNGSSSSS